MAFVLAVGLASIIAMGATYNSSMENSYRIKKERDERNLPRGSFPVARPRVGMETIFIETKDYLHPGNIDLPASGSCTLEGVSTSFDGFGNLGIPVKTLVKNDAYVQIYRPEVLFL